MNRKPLPAEPPVTIRDEYTKLPRGRIAAVVTHLEMYTPPALPAEEEDSPYRLEHVPRPKLSWYRDLYRAVGTNWLWFSRLTLDDAALTRLIHDPAIQVHVLRFENRDRGILELDTRRFPDVEISFLGVVEELIGKRAGSFLMDRALSMAWARSPRRVTVHTCTLDHPRALGFYIRKGFMPYARSVEIADDPRLHDILPRNAAPQIPILD